MYTIPTWFACCMILIVIIVCHACFRVIEKNHQNEMQLIEKMFRSCEIAIDTSVMQLENDIDRLIECLSDSEEEVCACACELDAVEEDDIHLISAEEFYLTRGEYTKCRFVYIPADDTLKYSPELEDEKSLIINNPVEYIGDGLRFFGVRSNDPKVVYVRNNKLETDFRVCKLEC